MTFVCLFISTFTGILSQSPSPGPWPYPATLWPNTSRVLFPRPRPLWGDPPSGQWVRGSGNLDCRAEFWLGRCGAARTWPLVHWYLHHVLTRYYALPSTHTKPLHPTALPSHRLPNTPLHLIAISVLAINSLSRAHNWALSQPPLRTTQPSQCTQRTPLTPVYVCIYSKLYTKINIYIYINTCIGIHIHEHM